MISKKITFSACSYPLFIDSNLIARLGEICDLYRFPSTRIVFTDRSETDPTIVQLQNLKNCQIHFFTSATVRSDFTYLQQIYSCLPWEKIAGGITVIVLAEETLIATVGFAIGLLQTPAQLICIPCSLWAMSEVAVNDRNLLNWQNQPAVFAVTFCPRLVLLDLQLLQQCEPNSFLLGLTGLLRHLLLSDSKQASSFLKDLPVSLPNPVSKILPLLEDLVSTRLTLLQAPDASRASLQDFGVRWLRRFQTGAKVQLSQRESSLLVLLEIGWRWRLAETIGWCSANEAENIFVVLAKINRHYLIQSDEWEQAWTRAAHCLEQEDFNHLYLPEKIGRTRQASEIDRQLSQQCLFEVAGRFKSK